MLEKGKQVQLKKKHPCGSDIFLLLRVGSDVRLRCTGCLREFVLSRLDAERSVKKELE